MSVVSRAMTATSGLTMSINDLPNLPGVRRDISSSNPSLYKRYLASIPPESRPKTQALQNDSDDYTLDSYFQDQEGSVSEWASVLSPFPSQGHAFNDTSGRYSLRSQKQDRLTRSGSLPFSRPETAPAFLCDTLRIARFIAYFNESVQGHGMDTERCRRVEITVHVEDNSIEIIEPKVADSGFLQGKLLKRHQVPKPDGTNDFSSNNSNMRKDSAIYTLRDFYSGAKIVVYNTTYTIIDADKNTRKYLVDELGEEFGSALPLPDAFKGKLISRGKPPMSADGGQVKRMTRGGSRPRQITTAANASGFFEYDRKVLRFYCVWDNRSALYGDIQEVRLHYYLADDTMEMLPVNSRNSGRDKLPKYLRKMRVPKIPTVNPGSGGSVVSLNASANLTSLEAVSSPVQYFHWSDLSIGKEIDIASIRLTIVNADNCTREFYASKGYTLGEAIAVEDEETRSIAAATQASRPNTGAATVLTLNDDASAVSGVTTGTAAPVKSEEVNMGCFIPVPLKKDGQKMNLYQGIILRYVAQMIGGKPGDEKRQFIILLYLEDDTLQIREPPLRNSGFSGGVFLKRTRMNTSDKAIPFTPFDVYIGAYLQVLSHRFLIHDADEYTLNYMTANDKLWSYSNVAQLLNKLKAQEGSLRKVFLTLPHLNAQHLTPDQVQAVMQRGGVKLNKQEVTTLFRELDRQKFGKVKLTRILKFIVDNTTEI